MSDMDEKIHSLFSKKERGVLFANDRRYAVGLTWLTVDQDLTQGSSALLKGRAAKLQADFYTVRSTIASQHGFGFLSLGHRLNLPAAASIAADMLVGDWHGVFRADNGWWYVAVHADNISPGGDKFFFSEEQAYTHFEQQNELYNWPRFYVPDSWEIEGASPEITLDKLIRDTIEAPFLKGSNLDAIFGGRKKRNFALIAILFGLIALIFAAILPATISKFQDKQQIAARQPIIAPAVIKPPPRAMETNESGFANILSLPRPSEAILSCARGFAYVISPLPGWQLNAAACQMLQNGQSIIVQTQWKREGGSLDLVRSYLSEFPSDVQLSFNGTDTISANFQIKDASKNKIPLRPNVREFQIQLLYQRFGGMGKLNITDIIPPAPPQQSRVGRVINEPPPQAPPYLKMVLETRTPPDILRTYFDVGGLKLQDIKWSIQNKSWTYTADILFDSQQFREFYGTSKN